MKGKISNYIEKNKGWLLEKLIDVLSVGTINNPSYGNENNGQDLLEVIIQ